MMTIPQGHDTFIVLWQNERVYWKRLSVYPYHEHTHPFKGILNAFERVGLQFGRV